MRILISLLLVVVLVSCAPSEPTAPTVVPEPDDYTLEIVIDGLPSGVEADVNAYVQGSEVHRIVRASDEYVVDRDVPVRIVAQPVTVGSSVYVPAPNESVFVMDSDRTHRIVYASDDPVASEAGIDPDAFADALEPCTPAVTYFDHPILSGEYERRIIGPESDLCVFEETMPNGGLMRCEYDEATRQVIAEFYRGTQTTYAIDGELTGNPLEYALDAGICEISGYS